MEKIKLFEEFILETSSRRLEDINSRLKKMIENTNDLEISFMLYYILIANVEFEKIEKLSKKYRGTRDCILRDDELTFDMDEAIHNYKKLVIKNDGKIQTKYDKIEESDYEKETLKTIENILDYYKKNKNVKSVTFHNFAKYIFKILRVIKKTDKESEASINNIISVILKNGIDIQNIKEDLWRYGEKNKDVSIVTRKSLKAGDLDGDERHNDEEYPVFSTTFWCDGKYKNNQIRLSLFVKKKEYFISLGYLGHQIIENVVTFNKNGEQTLDNNKTLLKNLGNVMKKSSEEFGDKRFKEVLNDIFEIFAKNGANVKFNFEDLKNNMEEYL